MSIPEPVDVAEPRGGQLRRLVLALLGVGVLIGVIAAVASLFLGGFSQTEAGLCRLTWAPCTELSVASVEQLGGVDLPAGTEVVSGYAQELSTQYEFRAEVVLPEGGGVTMSNSYDEAQEVIDVPGAEGLTGVRAWSRPLSAGDGYSHAVTGSRDGRTVIVFDEQYR